MSIEYLVVLMSQGFKISHSFTYGSPSIQCCSMFLKALYHNHFLHPSMNLLNNNVFGSIKNRVSTLVLTWYLYRLIIHRSNTVLLSNEMNIVLYKSLLLSRGLLQHLVIFIPYFSWHHWNRILITSLLSFLCGIPFGLITRWILILGHHLFYL